jgi:hypothetical protein
MFSALSANLPPKFQYLRHLLSVHLQQCQRNCSNSTQLPIFTYLKGTLAMTAPYTADTRVRSVNVSWWLTGAGYDPHKPHRLRWPYQPGRRRNQFWKWPEGRSRAPVDATGVKERFYPARNMICTVRRQNRRKREERRDDPTSFLQQGAMIQQHLNATRRLSREAQNTTRPVKFSHSLCFPSVVWFAR